MAASTDEPTGVVIDPVSGLPALTLGRPISASDVTEALDSE